MATNNVNWNAKPVSVGTLNGLLGEVKYLTNERLNVSFGNAQDALNEISNIIALVGEIDNKFPSPNGKRGRDSLKLLLQRIIETATEL